MSNLKTLFLVALITVACNQKQSHDTSELLPVNNNDTGFSIVKKRFLAADTVLLIGHLGLLNDDFPTTDDTLPAIITAGKLNYPIIKKKKNITKAELDTLLKILSMPDGEYFGPPKCGWNPHHSIVLIENGHCSYIDMCFSCVQFETSDDLKYFHHFSPEKWEILETFFEAKGVRYYQYQKRPK